MTNPKIEKVKVDILKTKGKITEYQGKLRDLERQKIDLENEEIIALFRREKLNEDEFAALLKAQHNEKNAVIPASIPVTAEEKKEGKPNEVNK